MQYGRSVNLQNMAHETTMKIYDFMNVQYIHNAQFAKALPIGYLETARYLADWHEYNIFSDPKLNGIGNSKLETRTRPCDLAHALSVAGQTILPSIVSGFQSIISSTDPIKFVYLAISYKPFISLFNMTKVVDVAPELAGIVNYASVVALEVRKPASGDPVLRFKFLNSTGTGTDYNFTTYAMLGSSGDTNLTDFINYVTTRSEDKA
ncbi:hypothetical protein H0H93_006130 [Arthromyces matolae]|nr:hypothetical protein H0H93_006130 [Arthromyces matolae]